MPTSRDPRRILYFLQNLWLVLALASIFIPFFLF